MGTAGLPQVLQPGRLVMAVAMIAGDFAYFTHIFLLIYLVILKHNYYLKFGTVYGNPNNESFNLVVRIFINTTFEVCDLLLKNACIQKIVKRKKKI